MSLSKYVSVQKSFLYSSFPCAALRITVLYNPYQKHNTIHSVPSCAMCSDVNTFLMSRKCPLSGLIGVLYPITESCYSQRQHNIINKPYHNLGIILDNQLLIHTLFMQ